MIEMKSGNKLEIGNYEGHSLPMGHRDRPMSVDLTAGHLSLLVTALQSA